MPEFVAAHLRLMREQGLAESTIAKRRQVLSRLAGWLGCPLCEATPGRLQDWRSGLTIGDDAIAADLSHVRQFYRWLVSAGLLDEDVSAGLPVPRLPRRLPRPIGEASLLAAVEAAPQRIRPWLVLAGWAGFRAKEIALLRRERVLETARPRPLLLVGWDATKGRAERYVPMCDFLLAELVPVLPAAGWVFRRMDGRPGPNTPNLVSHLCNEHLHGLGIAATLHQLRHRFGTGTMAASKDVRLVQELLGHQNLASTAVYTAVVDADAAAAVQALPAPRHLRVVSQ